MINFNRADSPMGCHYDYNGVFFGAWRMSPPAKVFMADEDVCHAPAKTTSTDQFAVKSWIK
jgi:hypothetical protein